MILYGAILQTIGPEGDYCNICPKATVVEEQNEAGDQNQ
jgi:hypothetical protein